MASDNESPNALRYKSIVVKRRSCFNARKEIFSSDELTTNDAKTLFTKNENSYKR
jgi:hypothetical protein